MASERILVVDDDPEYLDLLKHGILKAGFHCLTASGSPAAWRLLCQDVPDLVVLDQCLQEGSGKSLCERIRATPLISQVLVAFLTGDNAFADGEEWLKCGGDTCWFKPTSATRFVALVRGLLRRHALEGQARKLLGPGLWLDRKQRFATYNGRGSKKLTDRELDFIEALGTANGALVSREAAIQAVFRWSIPESPELAINEMLRKFRAKLPRALARAVETVHGQGFRLNLPGPDGEPLPANTPAVAPVDVNARRHGRELDNRPLGPSPR